MSSSGTSLAAENRHERMTQLAGVHCSPSPAALVTWPSGNRLGELRVAQRRPAAALRPTEHRQERAAATKVAASRSEHAEGSQSIPAM
jgi:hypothetical protein